jgi:molybdopterin molybdotransferase
LTLPASILGEAPVPVEAALSRILGNLAPLAETEPVALSAALARVLREDVVSHLDVPGADNSAVDGYAIHAEDLAPTGETRLPVIGRAAAGHPFAAAVPRGAALRIFTGALMPAGPDTVVMQEDCRLEGEVVAVPSGLKRGSNRRRAGEDVRAGVTVLAAGLRLRPQEIGLAAAIGRSRLTVARPLRAAVFSTGESRIHDSNRQGLGALLRQLAILVADGGILSNDRAQIDAALEAAAAENDVILTSGEVFRGEEDHLAAAVAARGSLRLWQLAVKPGRAVAIGELGGAGCGHPVSYIGLPGNPVAAITAFLCLARPMLLRLMGASDLSARRYRLGAGFAHRKKPGRREYLRARLTPGGDGDLAVLTFPAQGSGILSSLLTADGLVELPEALTKVERGSMVDFLPFDEIG